MGDSQQTEQVAESTSAAADPNPEMNGHGAGTSTGQPTLTDAEQLQRARPQARSSQVRAALDAVYAQQKGGKEPAATEPPAAETKPVADPPPVTDPPATDAQQPKKADKPEGPSLAQRHEELLEQSRQQRLQAREIGEREKRVQEMEQAQELLKSDPIAWVEKYGGQDFGDRFVSAHLRRLNGGGDGAQQPGESDSEYAKRIAKLEERLERQEMRDRTQAEQKAENDFVTENLRVWDREDEGRVVAAWFEDHERSQEIVNGARRVFEQRKAAGYSDAESILNPEQLLGMFHKDLRSRIERLAASDAGRNFLHGILGIKPRRNPRDEPKVGEQPNQQTPATETATLHMAAQGNADQPRVGRPSENRDLLAAALQRTRS